MTRLRKSFTGPDASEHNAVLSANLSGVPRMAVCNGGQAVAVAATATVIPHSLGEVPDFFLVNALAATRPSADANERALWTDKVIVIETAPAVTAYVFVGKL